MPVIEHRCEHCDEHDMVPGALAQRFKDERNQMIVEVERLREEYKRLAWCHLAAGKSCPACLNRARALGLEPSSAR